MTKSNRDIYSQLEELMIKYDNLSIQLKNVKADTEKKYKKQINDLKLENSNLKYELKYLKESVEAKINIAVNEAVKPYIEKIKTLEEENEKLKKENKLLKNDIDRLKNQINKNSSNSNMPTSTDIVPVVKKVNEYNSRISTKKVAGGQVGHKGFNLSKEDVEVLKGKENVEFKIVNHYVNNIITDNYISKYELDIKTITVVTEHRFYYDEESEYILPKEFRTDVTYGSNIKSLSILLNDLNVLPLKKLKDFFGIITENIIKISTGTIRNFSKEFNNKSESLRQTIKTRLLNSKVMYTDQTSSKLNSEKIITSYWFIIF